MLTPEYKLENDPMCGITTGGSEECFWDCEIDVDGLGNGPIIKRPECLLNCFEEVSTNTFSRSDNTFLTNIAPRLYFWIRQELKKYKCSSVCLSVSNLSRTHNLHHLASDSSWWLHDDFRMTSSYRRSLKYFVLFSGQLSLQSDPGFCCEWNLWRCTRSQPLYATENNSLHFWIWSKWNNNWNWQGHMLSSNWNSSAVNRGVWLPFETAAKPHLQHITTNASIYVQFRDCQ